MLCDDPSGEDVKCIEEEGGRQMINGQSVQRSVHLGVCASHTDMQIQKYANTKYKIHTNTHT